MVTGVTSSPLTAAQKVFTSTMVLKGVRLGGRDGNYGN